MLKVTELADYVATAAILQHQRIFNSWQQARGNNHRPGPGHQKGGLQPKPHKVHDVEDAND